MKVAIVHDWLPLYGGAERVLEQVLHLFPQADLFSTIDGLSPDERGFLGGRRVETSFVQRLPYGRTKYRNYFPLMPLAVEQFDLAEYDLIISSSYSFAKGVITGPDQLHICYCHSPIRYAWDMQHQYLNEAGLTRGLFGAIVRVLLHYIRIWDARTAAGVDAFVANSQYVARRIRKVYRRDSMVIYPPVDTERFTIGGNKEDFYFTASRMVPYKRIDLIVTAFAAMPDKRLVVAGDGPQFAEIKSRASSNVQFIGAAPADVLRDHMQRAKAFVFAAEEDFGIVPVEAQACGTPVIAFGRGGLRETVIDRETGVFFDEQTPESLIAAVQRFEAMQFDSAVIRRNAERFAIERFRSEFSEFVKERWREFEAVSIKSQE